MMNENKTFQTVRDTIMDVMSEVEKHNNTKAIFGDPIREKDTVIIPVAAVAIRGGGGGGGEGEEEDKDKKPRFVKVSGMGIGYARAVKPMGYIQIKDDKICYRPIVDANKIAAIIAGVTAIGGLFALKSFWQSQKE